MQNHVKPLVFAHRATALLAKACSFGSKRVILLPALYCAEVADAIVASGSQYRCYDMPSDLSSTTGFVEQVIGPDVGGVVILHPFGLARPVEEVSVSTGVLLIEDACHALRTASRTEGIGKGDLVVYSPRKELGWPEGGVASGRLAPQLAETLPHSPAVAQRWFKTNVAEISNSGRWATERAAAVLGDRLPMIASHDVLTALPLLGRQRDVMINRLRGRNILAWRWRQLLAGVGPKQTPNAWKLQERLFLVPMCAGDALERVLDLLQSEPLEPWS